MQLQPKGVVICRGPLQAMEQLLLPVEAALIQLPIPRRVLDRPQQQVLYYIEQDSLLLLKQLALQSLVMLIIPMELQLSYP